MLGRKRMEPLRCVSRLCIVPAEGLEACLLFLDPVRCFFTRGFESSHFASDQDLVLKNLWKESRRGP